MGGPGLVMHRSQYLLTVTRVRYSIPFDLSSLVHPLSNSWTSSGSTSLRSQASAQRGFGGGGGAPPLNWDRCLLLDVEPAGSLLRNREKKGIFGRRVVGSPAVGVAQGIRATRRTRFRFLFASGASMVIRTEADDNQHLIDPWTKARYSNTAGGVGKLPKGGPRK